MVTIAIHFLAGRFHATPWDRHVNEGVVEWPISPWRLLRALMAVGFRKLGWDPANPPGEAKDLFNVLSEVPPQFWLPPATTAHTRHYMPKYRSVLDGKTDRVIDAFVSLDPEQAVIAHWPRVEVDDGKRQLLKDLLINLSYLGRAESWVEASLVDRWSGTPNALTVDGGGTYTNADRVTLLAPMPPGEYGVWRDAWLGAEKKKVLEEKRSKSKAKAPGKIQLSPKDLSALDGKAGRTLFDAMLADTGELQNAGWNLPPGSRWVDYARPAGCFTVRPTRRKVRKKPAPTVAKFTLTAESVHADVRPRLLDALYIADHMRKALMSLSANENDGVPSVTFSGKNEDGQPLRGHQHAFFLPLDDDDDGRIEGMIIYAPRGFSDLDQVAMGRLRKLWQHGGRPGLYPMLAGTGHPSDFGGLDAARGLSPILAKASLWESRTPFVLMRHPKRRRNGEPKCRSDSTWIDGPVDQLRREMASRDLPQPACIEWVDHTKSRGKKMFWNGFAKLRRDGHGSFAGGGYGFRLTFSKPVSGPIALGYGCHYGLGQFRAIG